MRLFGLVIKRARPINHDLTDEERDEGSAAGVEARRRKALQRRMDDMERSIAMEERLAAMEEHLAELSEGEEEGEQGIDGLFKNTIEQILIKKFLGGAVSQEGSASASITPQPTPQQVETLTDDAIKEKLSSLPKQYLKVARKLDDETLKQFLRKNTQYDEDTITRAVALFRNENF